jgi:hypothetical protein
MRKNVAGQYVAGQLISKTTGDPVTSGVSVFCVQDNGTQTAGAGTLVHKGNGEWMYLPTQGETNGNHVTFTFVHASAVVQTVQIYTIGYDPQNPGWSSGGGTGAFLITVLVTDGTNPLQNATVQVTDLITPATLTTDVNGNATFSLDAGTYWVSVTRSGYQFTPVQRTVVGNQSGTLTAALVMTQVTIPGPPSDLSLCRVYGYLETPDNRPASRVTVTFTLVAPNPTKSERLVATRKVLATTDENGQLFDMAGNPWVDLQRNDLMTPNTTYYLVDCQALMMAAVQMTLTTSTRDLLTLVP